MADPEAAFRGVEGLAPGRDSLGIVGDERLAGLAPLPGRADAESLAVRHLDGARMRRVRGERMSELDRGARKGSRGARGKKEKKGKEDDVY